VGEEATSNIRGSEKMLPPHHSEAETFMEDLGEGLGKDISQVRRRGYLHDLQSTGSDIVFKMMILK
jgi:hypothetical protein